jgi:hypothetical protein
MPQSIRVLRTATTALLVGALLVPVSPALAAGGNAGPTGMVVGDWDGDGRDDLGIGVPEEDIGTESNAGAVNVLYGRNGGLDDLNNQFWHQDSPGVRGVVDMNDEFGANLAGGDFNNDGFDDLAIGTPFDENPTGGDISGSVTVLYGSNQGLTADGDDFWYEDAPNVPGVANDGDRFGAALAVGDFKNGRADDLAIGVPGDIITVGMTDIGSAGSVHLLFGSSNGLRAVGSEFWHQNRPGVRQTVESGDNFGLTLAAGDGGRSNTDDLAIGAPLEEIGEDTRVGLVHVLYGKSDGGLSANDDDLLRQGVAGMPDGMAAEERTGYSLTFGQLGRGDRKDLVIGAPLEDISGFTSAGIVIAVYGGDSGLRPTTGQKFSRMRLGFGVDDDTFGNDLVIADLTASDRKDLAVGSEFATVQGVANRGAVHVIKGTRRGLRLGDDRVWHQNSTGVVDFAESFDSFGLSLGAGDFGRSGAPDLAIGVPGESLFDATPAVTPGAGAAHVLYGMNSRLSAQDDQFWNQDSPGVLDFAEDNDRFSSNFDTLD